MFYYLNTITCKHNTYADLVSPKSRRIPTSLKLRRDEGAIIQLLTNLFYQEFLNQTIETFLSVIATLRYQLCDMTSFKNKR